jgi:hypothetical protein
LKYDIHRAFQLHLLGMRRMFLFHRAADLCDLRHLEGDLWGEVAWTSLNDDEFAG